MRHITLFVAAAMMIGLYSCGNDNNDPTEFPPNVVPFDENTTTDRQYLEDTANDFLDYVSPGDQRTALTALHALVTMCDTYQWPEGFEDKALRAVSRNGQAMADMLEHYDVMSWSRGATQFAYSVSRFSGLYQADSKSEVWQYIEPQESIRLRYFIGQSEYNLVVMGEGGQWSETYTDDRGDTYTVDIPRTLKVVLYNGQPSADSKLFYALIKTDGKDNDHLNATSEVTLANVRVESTTKATNTTINEDVRLFIDNVSTLYRTDLSSATSTLTGQNLCSIRAWANVSDNDDAIASMVTGASATMMVIQRVQFKAKVNNVRDFAEYVDTWYGNYDSSDPQGEAAKAAGKLSSAVNVDVYYAGDSNKVRATLGWEPYLYDEWDSYEEWGIRPTVTFASDGATFDFESYFGNNRFLSVENKLTSMLNSYKQYWR